ncbi:hypothetical protein HDV64DRAFT_91229 [Trichoderma sp. TUCIM 5745]
MPREIYMPPLLGCLWPKVRLLASVVSTHYVFIWLIRLSFKMQTAMALRIALAMNHISAPSGGGSAQQSFRLVAAGLLGWDDSWRRSCTYYSTTLRTRRRTFWPLAYPDVGDGRPWLRLQRALGSSGDGSATTAIGKALVAPIARLSGNANGCLHYPPADT